MLPLGVAGTALAAGLPAMLGGSTAGNAIPKIGGGGGGLAAVPQSDLSVPMKTPRQPAMGGNLGDTPFWAGDHPWVDRMKTADRWSAVREDYSTAALADVGGVLDAQGWPTSVPPGFVRVQTYVQAHYREEGRPTRYVILNTGSGTVGAGAREVSRSRGRLVVDVGDVEERGWFAVTVTGPLDPGNPPRIRVCREDHEKLLVAGTLFNPDSLARMKPYGAVRFMDWQQTNNSPLTDWAGRPRVEDCSYATERGVPLEMQVALANALGCDGWFNLPARATDEYVWHAVTLLRDTMRPEATVYLECSNEWWNSGLFRAYHEFQAMADKVPGLGWNGHEYGGYRAAQMAVIADQVFRGRGRRSSLRNVFAVQTGYRAINDYRLSKMTHPGGQGLPATGVTAVNQVFDDLAITTYFDGGLTPAADYPEAERRARRDFTLSCVRGGEEGFRRAFRQWQFGDLTARAADVSLDGTLPGLLASTAWWRRKAQGLGLGLVAYEGGPVTLSRNADWGPLAPELTEWIGRLVMRPEMETIYRLALEGCAAVGLTLNCHFSHCARGGGGSEAGWFGALNYETQDPTPRYRAITGFADTLRRRAGR